MIKATLIKELDGGTGAQSLFKLSDHITVDGAQYDHVVVVSAVVVSATVVPYSGPETYIFVSDAEGVIQNWCELDGSYRGGLNRREAIEGAGWEYFEPGRFHTLDVGDEK